MATIDQRPLKAFVRFDGTGRIVPSSLILRRKKPKVGKWVEIPAYECCNPVPSPILPLRMLFSNIVEVTAIIGDVANVADWNTYFDLPTYGTSFTSVSVTGNEIKLYGGSNIIIKQSLFDQIDQLGTYLLEMDDAAGCIVEVEYDGFGWDNNSGCKNVSYMNLPALIIAGDYAFNALGDTILTSLNFPQLQTTGQYCFSGCISVTSFSLPVLETAGTSSFGSCTSLTTISLPQLQTAGGYCFYNCGSLTTISLPLCINLGGTVGDDNVFGNFLGNTITLTVPSALMTANAGSPDGDIVYLQANNTVTIVTV